MAPRPPKLGALRRGRGAPRHCNRLLNAAGVAPLADLGGVLAIVAGASAVEGAERGAALGEVLFGNGRGGGHEVAVRGLELGEAVGDLDAGLVRDEPRVPPVEEHTSELQ